MSKPLGSSAAIAALMVIVMGLAGCAVGTAANTSSVQGPTAKQKAADDFTSASDACTAANTALATALSSASVDSKTKASAVEKPTVLTALKKAITAANSLNTCTPPAMSAQVGTIQAQAKDMTQQAAALRTAASAVREADQAVKASVAQKHAAVQAAKAAAAAKARTWHENAGNGYTYDVSLAVGEPTTGEIGSGRTVGDVCTDFNPATDLAVPYTLTVRSTTKHFDIPSLTVDLFAYGFGDVELTDGAWYIGNLFTATDGGSYEAEEYYSSSNTSCWQPGQSLGAGLINVQWSSGLAAGATSTWDFTFIVKGYKSPQHPHGNPHLLSSIGLSPKLMIFILHGDKVLTLDNKIITG